MGSVPDIDTDFLVQMNVPMGNTTQHIHHQNAHFTQSGFWTSAKRHLRNHCCSSLLMTRKAEKPHNVMQ